MPSIVQTNRPPKYERIAGKLRRRIVSGELDVGARLPGEHELADQHGVHRQTARRALDELAREGLVERTPGRGTFVAARRQEPTDLGVDRCVGLAMRASGHIFADEVRFLVGRLQHRGLLTLLLDLTRDANAGNNGPTSPAPTVRRALALDLAAVVLDGGFLRDALQLEPALGQRRPVIVMNRLTEDPAKLDSPALHSVTTDHRATGQMVARHLLDQGHRRLLFCGYGYSDPQQPWNLAADSDWSEREFLAGCQDALAEHQLAPSEAICLALNVSSSHGPRPDLEALLAAPERPTAAILLGDFRAPSLYGAAERAGLAVGRDLAVVGFGNTPWTTSLRPGLSSIDLCAEELADALDALIARLLTEPTLSPQHVRIRPRLVIRESSAGSQNER